jgi:carboxylesterase
VRIGAGSVDIVRCVSPPADAPSPPPSAAHAGLLAGAEPFSAAGGDAGALLLHGFTGTPFAMRRTAERLAAAGLTVEAPLLPGHGTRVEDLVPMRWADWSAAAERAYSDLRSRCSRVAVAGHSMGGTLACWLAERHAEVPGIALVNPLVEPFPDEVRHGARQLVAAGTDVWPGSTPDVADPDVRYPTYDGTPLAAFLSLCEGAEEVALRLDAVRCPVLLISSREDHVVPPSNGDLVASCVGGEVTRVHLQRSYHAAMVDFDHEEVERRIEGFVRSVTAAPA